ncbi:MAG TPA: purine-nucleoside phosphorylase [Saprospiraceae bacterium]|nr:purine-nucleoside phosphorylase [Saprospiraceae bacterium]
MPTPHIEAQLGEIAETILLPGDPLRAKYIAENFLTDCVQFNKVRNMLGYTGYYEGKKVAVMGTGMGMPSMGIYAYELIKFYGVKRLIRVGSAGSIQPHIKLKDIVIAQGASTNSSFSHQFKVNGQIAALSDYHLLASAVNSAQKNALPFHIGNLLTTDNFYNFGREDWQPWANMGVSCLEMEGYSLLLTAMSLKASALVMCTISDSLITEEAMTSQERLESFHGMITLALDIV